MDRDPSDLPDSAGEPSEPAEALQPGEPAQPAEPTQPEPPAAELSAAATADEPTAAPADTEPTPAPTADTTPAPTEPPPASTPAPPAPLADDDGPDGTATSYTRTIAVAVVVIILAAAGTVWAIVSHGGGSSKNAATVGSFDISVDTLNAAVNTSLADTTVTAALTNPQYSQSLGTDRVSFTRYTLGRLISDRIIAEMAAARHITVTSQQVTAQTQSLIQQAGSLTTLRQSAAQEVGISALQLPELIRITVLQQQLTAALIAPLPATQAQLEQEYQKDIDSYDQLQVAQIAVTGKALANRLLRMSRANPSSFGSLAAKYSDDQATKTNGGLVGYVGRSQVVSLLGNAKAAKPGTFTVAHSGTQYIVLHIISRKVQPLSQVTEQVKEAMYAAKTSSLLESAAAAEATKLGVKVDSTYGRWDNATQSILPPGGSTTTSPSATPSPTVAPSTVAAPTKCATITPNPPAVGEPKIPDVTGKPPVKLVSHDITVGHGQPAKSGDKITVKYVGVSCSTGKAFDASYTDGAKNKEFSFTLGQGDVIPGWDQGLVGMKPGGVRELVIPPALGYGAQGSGPIAPNETLIFVVTMDKVG